MQLKSIQKQKYLSNKSIIVSTHNSYGIICDYSLKEQELVVVIIASPHLAKIDKTKCYIDEKYINIHQLVLVPIYQLNRYLK